MASITSLSNSLYKSNSIYGNRNVLSGLASGMDTETMIENAVSGIKLKIQSLQQKRTKVEWQQEAYRSIIDKMYDFSQKYTSYASNTNLSSASFFNSAVKTTTNGVNKDMISATGKTNSDVQILGVRQLAAAASYTVGGSAFSAGSGDSIVGEKVNLGEKMSVSAISGTLTLNYGGERQIDLSFGELENIKAGEGQTNTQALAKAINQKLSEVQVGNSSGNMVEASTMIRAEVNGNQIRFVDAQGAGNNVTVGFAAGDIKDQLGIDNNAKASSITVGNKALVKEVNTGDYLAGKTMNVTLDGVTKRIELPGYEKGMSGQDYLKQVQKKLDSAFGKDKITVKTDSPKAGTTGGFGKTSNGEFKLEFSVKEGSTLNVTSPVDKALGLPEGGASNYINTGKTLGELLGKDFDWGNMAKAQGQVTEVKPEKGNSYFMDSKGNRVAKSTDGSYYQVDENGKYLYDFTVNGVSVGRFNEDTALESVMSSINANADAGVKVSYSKITNEFRFTATETGAGSKIEFGEGLARNLFGDTAKSKNYEEGKDAILSMSVNGRVYDGIARSSNTFDVDGLNVTLKGKFGEYSDAGVLVDREKAKADAVSFTSASDSDKIVDAVKSMVEDYNALVTEIKNAYSTMPAQKSNGSRYEPLTAEEEANYSETERKAYEEKAKQGILFADRDLSALYRDLNSAVSATGLDGVTLREIGIDTSYSGGLTTISLDEDKLRSALESDPDKVRNAFSKSVDRGSSSNGLMQSLMQPLDRYGKTLGEPKGILVSKAGSVRAPTSLNNNTLNSQINSYDEQIERWENKMADQIDRYTSQFSKLEQLIAQMNSQSSTLSGLMGGFGSY